MLSPLESALTKKSGKGSSSPHLSAVVPAPALYFQQLTHSAGSTECLLSLFLSSISALFAPQQGGTPLHRRSLLIWSSLFRRRVFLFRDTLAFVCPPEMRPEKERSTTLNFPIFDSVPSTPTASYSVRPRIPRQPLVTCVDSSHGTTESLGTHDAQNAFND